MDKPDNGNDGSDGITRRDLLKGAVKIGAGFLLAGTIFEAMAKQANAAGAAAQSNSQAACVVYDKCEGCHVKFVQDGCGTSDYHGNACDKKVQCNQFHCGIAAWGCTGRKFECADTRIGSVGCDHQFNCTSAQFDCDNFKSTDCGNEYDDSYCSTNNTGNAVPYPNPGNGTGGTTPAQTIAGQVQGASLPRSLRRLIGGRGIVS